MTLPWSLALWDCGNRLRRAKFVDGWRQDEQDRDSGDKVISSTTRSSRRDLTIPFRLGVQPSDARRQLGILASASRRYIGLRLANG